MATAITASTYATFLKRRYASDWVKAMTYKDHRLLSMIPKEENMVGETWDQPTLFGDIQAGSATFSTAQTLSTTKTPSLTKFAVTRVTDYGVSTVSTESMRASRGKEGAFMEAKTLMMDSIMRTVARSAAIQMYRTGWGALSRFSTTVAATPTITLGTTTGGATPADTANFEPGMVVQFAASLDSDDLRAAGATLTVLSVDRSAGTVTFTANINTIAALAANDFIFRSGDRAVLTAGSARQKIAGFGDWFGDTAPTATTFFSVNRSLDTRLGGARLDATGGSPIEEMLINGATLLDRLGGTPDYCYMNPMNYGKLINELGSKRQYVDVKAQANIGFRAIEAMLPTGSVTVISDRDCPSNRIFLTQNDTLMLGSLDALPGLLADDGNTILRQSSDDGYEVRMGYYGNMVCKAPGWNCNIQTPIPT